MFTFSPSFRFFCVRNYISEDCIALNWLQILRNCDALFDTDAAFDITTDHYGKLDTNVFLFSPGTRTYKRLLELVGNAKPEGKL